MHHFAGSRGVKILGRALGRENCDVFAGIAALETVNEQDRDDEISRDALGNGVLSQFSSVEELTLPPFGDKQLHHWQIQRRRSHWHILR